MVAGQVMTDEGSVDYFPNIWHGHVLRGRDNGRERRTYVI